MLKQIFIKNIALIDKIEADFYGGLNILTGETGAGKSIIIDSINAILGSRVSKDLIRTGQSSATVEAFFEIGNSGALDFLKSNELVDEDGGELSISREFNVQGKNVCRVNGRIVTVAMLRELGQYLLDIHGQHDNQSLLNTASHIELLDSFGGEKVLKVKREYTSLYDKAKDINNKISQLGGDSRERERKIDLLRFQLDEIDSAKLKAGEDEELEAQRNLMVNSEKMVSSIEESYDILYAGSKRQSILDSLNIVMRELSNIQRFDTKIDEYLKKVQEIYYSAEDVVHEIRSYKDSLEYDPRVLEEIEERLDNIHKLKRKYGSTIAEILEYCDNIQNELADIEGSQEKLDQYTRELEDLNKSMLSAAEKLSDIRKDVAKELEVKVVRELEDLEMKRTQFSVSFERSEEVQFTPNGIDKIEFLISPNAGESLKSLSKIASGGEMSRIMLAIKTILAGVDEIPTLIFDEIDIGISGKAAQMVGQKLSFIAKSHQVLCITHLPQIAAMSDNHYLIEKSAVDNETKTSIKRLDVDEKRNEVARILGGANITETTLKHAQEMIDMAKEKRA